ncbi:MAG: T9SS type A sorting domain-containing protein [Bacteroidetes bacterium]|nr:T9SS type A sorting domain-containing protein [Bacteroidota bacterium]
MRHKKYKLFATILLVFVFRMLHAQEVIPATGGNASGSGGSVSYTIGQFVYSTNTGLSGSEAQGVQQAFEISVVNVTEAYKDIRLSCSVFPNPVDDYIKLNIENHEFSAFSFSLFDINGKLLEWENIAGKETLIFMKKYTPSTYFLKVSDNNKEVKLFKIIKN